MLKVQENSVNYKKINKIVSAKQLVNNVNINFNININIEPIPFDF